MKMKAPHKNRKKDSLLVFLKKQINKIIYVNIGKKTTLNLIFFRSLKRKVT